MTMSSMKTKSTCCNFCHFNAKINIIRIIEVDHQENDNNTY